FDVIVLGTGIVESVAAAALAKAGFKIAHLDINGYYGGDQASLTGDELVTWADARSVFEPDFTPYIAAQRAQFASIVRSTNPLAHSRHFSFSLLPALIPAVGPFISSLIASGVAKYGSYRVLERVAVFDESTQQLRSVPTSKEDIFKSTELSLVDKRRLMRLLSFAAGEFENKSELVGKEQQPFVNFLISEFKLNSKIAYAITYATAFCSSADEPTVSALSRLRTFLRSSGRYGASPFLVGHYGGLGEIAQGFCRAAAISGAVYILGQSTLPAYPPSLENGNKYSFQIENVPEPLTADIVLSAQDVLPQSLAKARGPTLDECGSSVACGIVVLNRPPPFPPTLSPASGERDQTEDQEGLSSGIVDTAVVVFPPSTVSGGSTTAAAHALITGQGTMSAPVGKYVLYFSLPVDRRADAKTALMPYLDAFVACYPNNSRPTSEFEVFY
ncbi:GDP dissociation inhibitor-domain-containing protein, partial [Vararia minispora EC-137]